MSTGGTHELLVASCCQTQGNELSETREGDGSDVAVVEVVDTLTGGSSDDEMLCLG